MNRIISLVIFLVSLLAIVNASTLATTNNFDGMVSVSVGDDLIRGYSIVLSEISQTMSFTGVSLSGTLDDPDNVNLSFDSTSFVFTSLGNFISYAQSYFSGTASSTSTGTNGGGAVAGFVALYQLYALAEYEETNNEDGFQFGEDKLEGWLLMGSPRYDFSQTSTSFNTTLNNGTQVSFKAFNVVATSGVVTLRFTVSEAPIEIAGQKISSESSKIDIEVNNYFDDTVNKQSSVLCTSASAPFSCGATGPSSNPNSRIALISAYISASADVKFDGSAQGGVIRGETVQGKFDFVTTVDASVNGNNVTANVITTAKGFVAGEAPDFLVSFDATANIGYSGQFLVQAFDAVRPANIVWDPSVGVEKSFGAILLPSLSLILLIVFALLF